MKTQIPEWIFYFLSVGDNRVCEMPIGFRQVISGGYNEDDYLVGNEVGVVRGHSTKRMWVTRHKIIKRALRRDQEGELILLVMVGSVLE